MSRVRCARCGRVRCLCVWIPPPLPHQTELFVLQHPLEVQEVKGTGRLAQLALACVHRVVGERFEPPPNPERRFEALLYPGTGPTESLAGTPPERLRLYVLDGTWRKSRRLLHLNPWLAALPRLSLNAPLASTYGQARKAHAPHQLSTLEACAAALQQLEGLDPAPLMQLQADLIRSLLAFKSA
ncbi:tRNA-uridine aminocarboxypropyltransferase [Inhella gelatinilytica]|uniref:tRNA-uridine aminocarboxypropyltransferase n=1 Tax=Inhella gelatinilytica TaxID=2795030 RepID=A0A931NFE6_9BURK|nr:tRNA-uridine aminocarboxypropyltransferase [Inhella gelatinilytica]MBH9554165.1 DTW domain-containing protein [Inhella gelatinilytica]